MYIMKKINYHYCNCSDCPKSISAEERKKIIDKIYYEEKIKPIKNKIKCPCGGSYFDKAVSKNQHRKTKKHLKYLKNLPCNMCALTPGKYYAGEDTWIECPGCTLT